MALRWYELQKPLVEKVGVEVWNKAAHMYQEMDQWQTPQVQAPFSATVYGFAVQASNAEGTQDVGPQVYAKVYAAQAAYMFGKPIPAGVIV